MKIFCYLMPFIVLTGVITFFAGCKKDEGALEEKKPVNSFSFDYDGQRLVFNEVVLYGMPAKDQEYSEFTAYGVTSMQDKEYHFFLYYELDRNQYYIESLRIDIKDKLTESVFLAILLKQFKMGEIFYTIHQSRDFVKGSFSGSLASNMGKEIKISNGLYVLDVTTARRSGE